MNRRLEQDEEWEYCRWLSSNLHGLALKLIFFSGLGWPDRTVLLKGGILMFIEFKIGKNTLSAHQEYWKKVIIELGFTYHVCYSFKEAKRVTRLALLSKETTKKVSG